MDRFTEMSCFVQVADAGSYSAAARQIAIAKSSLSRRISELERRLGAQLFNRTTRQLHLTEIGEAFYHRATTVLADLEEAELTVASAQEQLRGKLKIAAPLSFTQLHLRPMVTAFLRAHPEIDLELDLNDRRVDLVAQGFDAALRVGVLEDSSLIARRLAPIRHAVAAAPAYWEKVGRPLAAAELERMDCLAYSNVPLPGVLRCTAPSGEPVTIRPPVRLRAGNGDFLKDAAIEGLGFVLEPTFVLADDIRAGRLEPVLLDHEWSHADLFVVYPPTRQVSSRVRAFIDALVDRFANNPYWDRDVFDA